MGATFEAITGTLRAGPEHRKYGDPWVFAATVQVLGDVAYISAAHGTYGTDTARALRKALRKQGVRRVVFHRQKADRSYDVSIGGGKHGTILD